MSDPTEVTGGSPATDDGRTPLDLLDRAALRKRSRLVMLGAALLAAALGGVVGLIAGRNAGLLVAAVVALPLILLAVGEARRTSWLDGTTLCVRAFGTRRVDLRAATRIELLITQSRGARTISLLVGGPPRNKTITLALATYTVSRGGELGIIALRKLADALADSANTSGLVYAELLVAQLRAEAREEAGNARPLYLLAAAAPDGRLAQRIGQEAVVRFVSKLN